MQRRQDKRQDDLVSAVGADVAAFDAAPNRIATVDAEAIDVEVGVPSRGSSGSRRRIPWAAVGGVVSLGYVVWYVGDLVLLRLSPFNFNAAHRLYGNVGVRAVFALTFLGMLGHGVHGLRLTFADLIPRLGRHDVLLRTTAGFVTFAVWIPCALLVLWPSIRWWFAR